MSGTTTVQCDQYIALFISAIAYVGLTVGCYIIGSCTRRVLFIENGAHKREEICRCYMLAS